MKQVFINLPVVDVEKSMKFYTQLGFSNNPLFSDGEQKCMVWSEQIYVMLQSREFFISFIKKPLLDTTKNVSATFTLPVESLERVNEVVENGLKAGGVEPSPMQDEGFMQLRSIEDLDGHTWAIIYLDMDKFRATKNVK
ncbi:glyoxalase/bleomycin resistance/extradiol dioxygenase family protein [Pedobacter frigidisoli]|uniref:Glyoxalase/bleomycin resistance/extradiol dioxygenase family protein n=1 Tax=Pedobacter frigidisoli TaxID=2530455 RepID=A0A4R0NML7_9SPHI|nr:glyoxalase/bleomycin resistance/extradiol dioxygenase family protein [Pedobacter frigidisoli]TCD02122.1 glyoxalase/bleomycin resistance/extradiol dioxygenase family protein [Pedobacter frigidisoli]